MKRTITTFSAALIFDRSDLDGGDGAVSAAQRTASRGGEVSRFDNGYLDEHPEVAQSIGT